MTLSLPPSPKTTIASNCRLQPTMVGVAAKQPAPGVAPPSALDGHEGLQRFRVDAERGLDVARTVVIDRDDHVEPLDHLHADLRRGIGGGGRGEERQDDQSGDQA